MRTAFVKLPGHPDKACDLVAEAIVDEYVRRDPETRIRLAVTGGRGALFVCGDVKTAADFDVASVVRRTIGSLGIAADLEPFVSIEPVAPEQAPLVASGILSPVTVTGYATTETPERVPVPVAMARRIAKALEEKRQRDESWFWLGPDGGVFASCANGTPLLVSVLVEHGVTSIEEVRANVTDLVKEVAPDATVRVNELGANEARGLGLAIGASGRDVSAYGSLLPSAAGGIGLEPAHAEKAGTWLARDAARRLVESGANAALVHLTWHPGEKIPAKIHARDERGKDLSKLIDRDSLSLDRAMKDWWRPGLCAEAARWGFAGEAGLPWE